MEENNINVVDYSDFLGNLQQSNLDIYDKVDKILIYFQEKDKQEKEKEQQELKEQQEKDKLELQEQEDEEVIDYNSMFHEELIKIQSNTEYCKNLELLDSINNLLICIVLFLGIIVGIMSFNSLARFFKW